MNIGDWEVFAGDIVVWTCDICPEEHRSVAISYIHRAPPAERNVLMVEDFHPLRTTSAIVGSAIVAVEVLPPLGDRTSVEEWLDA